MTLGAFVSDEMRSERRLIKMSSAVKHNLIVSHFRHIHIYFLELRFALMMHHDRKSKLSNE